MLAHNTTLNLFFFLKRIQTESFYFCYYYYCYYYYYLYTLHKTSCVAFFAFSFTLSPETVMVSIAYICVEEGYILKL